MHENSSYKSRCEESVNLIALKVFSEKPDFYTLTFAGSDKNLPDKNFVAAVSDKKVILFESVSSIPQFFGTIGKNFNSLNLNKNSLVKIAVVCDIPQSLKIIRRKDFDREKTLLSCFEEFRKMFSAHNIKVPAKYDYFLSFLFLELNPLPLNPLPAE